MDKPKIARPKILVQLDTDAQPSVFDGVAAVDAGAEQLFRHGGVGGDGVRDLVYGAMFTRGPDELHQTAIFIGGSNVTAGENLLAKVIGCFFGPMRVSVMLDSNGANTTAAAAVLAAGKHVALRGARAAVLAATGPVGRRVVRLLAHEGAQIAVASRSVERAEEVCREVGQRVPDAVLAAHESATPSGLARAIEGADVIIAAGAPGVTLLSAADRGQCQPLRVAIDLSAVPPAGIEGIKPTDKAASAGDAVFYGAIGVGGTKMKIHKAAIQKLFTANNLVLDAEEIYELGQAL